MSHRGPFTLLAVCLLAAPVAVVACDGGTTSGTTPSPSQVTVTQTVTSPSTEPSPPPTPTVAPTTVTAPPPTTRPPPAPSASAVVGAYFDAINAGDFRAAWNLGGQHFAASYDAFVAGFTGLAHDDLTVLSTTGRTVTARLDAVQSDGTTRVFQGDYTVSGGEIVAADVHEVGSPAPTGTGYPNCTAAHNQGVYDIPRSDPAYRPDLDRDNDGIACEHYDDE